MWLEVSITNNDPEVIAWYYLRSVEKVQGIQHCVYSVTYNNSIIIISAKLS